MSVIPLALYHALRAELAIASHVTGLRLEAITDATNRAQPFFCLNASGELESLSGETVAGWLNRLRDHKPFYFHSSDGVGVGADAGRPTSAIHGTVGDGKAMTRLVYSNRGAA